MDRFLEALQQDCSAQAMLSPLRDREIFAAQSMALAESWGMTIALDTLRQRIMPDPLGLMQFETASANCRTLPPPGWIPIGLAQAAEPCIDWGWYEGDPDTPFYEDALRSARCHPLTRLLRPRTALQTLMAAPQTAPEALVFHMSRCGSTLLHRMFAASGSVLSLSEPGPLDALLEASIDWPHSLRLAALRAVASATGRGSRRYMIKTDSWHVLAWRLFQEAFPQSRAVFLFREPRAVLASQFRERGVQTFPQPRFAELYGIADWQEVPSDVFCARGLAAICRAGLDACQNGAMTAVEYRSLPEAATGFVLDVLKIAMNDAERARMQAAAQQDSKTPQLAFAPRPAPASEKDRARIDSLARTHLDAVYEGLCALAMSGKNGG